MITRNLISETIKSIYREEYNFGEAKSKVGGKLSVMKASVSDLSF